MDRIDFHRFTCAPTKLAPKTKRSYKPLKWLCGIVAALLVLIVVQELHRSQKRCEAEFSPASTYCKD